MILHETATEPFSDPEIFLSAVSSLNRAAAMGLLPEDFDARSIDEAMVRRLVDVLAGHGIARGLQPLARSTLDRAGWETLLDRLAESLDGSPAPASEARTLANTLDTGLLAELMGVTAVTVNRWVRGDREPDDLHAGRLHWLTGVTADLQTAYNEVGVRRWFARRRVQLGDRSPQELLGADWDPEGADAQRVRQLAAWLSSPGAT